MISLSELKTAFKDYKYYYGYAPLNTKLPYIVAEDADTDNFAADGKVYAPKVEMTLSCYFSSKNETTESAIETILDSLGLFWNKSETHDEDESFYLIIYSFWR